MSIRPGQQREVAEVDDRPRRRAPRSAPTVDDAIAVDEQVAGLDQLALVDVEHAGAAQVDRAAAGCGGGPCGQGNPLAHGVPVQREPHYRAGHGPARRTHRRRDRSRERDRPGDRRGVRRRGHAGAHDRRRRGAARRRRPGGCGRRAAPRSTPLAVDVRDPDAVDRLAEAAVEHFGRLHVAVNNAGIVATGNSWELPLDDWHRVIDVDLWGVIHGIRAFVPRILATGEPGHVVNTASMAAVRRDRPASGPTRRRSTACSACPTCCGPSSRRSAHPSA